MKLQKRGKIMACFKGVTKQQKEVLEVIVKFIDEKGFSPTVRELMDLLKLCSTSTVHGYLNRLERHGYISRTPSSPRTIRVLRLAHGDEL